MTKFKVGDEVVCVNNSRYEGYAELNKVYTIKSIHPNGGRDTVESTNNPNDIIELEETKTGGMYARRFKLAEKNQMNSQPDKYFQIEFKSRNKYTAKNPQFDGKLIRVNNFFNHNENRFIDKQEVLGEVSDLYSIQEITKEHYEALISPPHILINGRKIEAIRGELVINIGNEEVVSIDSSYIKNIYDKLSNLQSYQQEFESYSFKITPVVEFGCQKISHEDCQKLCKFIEDNKLV